MTIPFPKSTKKSIKEQMPEELLKFTHESNMHPYDFIYISYDYRSDLNSLYKRYSSNLQEANESMDDRSIFRGVDRLKLIHSIINSNVKECARLDIYRLLREECVLGYFPLHDLLELPELEKKWLLLFQFPWNQNVDAVKDYFGEKIGLYFLWTGHYTTWLTIAGLAGLGVWCNVMIDTNASHAVSMPYFASFICIWSTFYLEHWKRTERTYIMRWGMVGFEDEEQVRPQYHGIKTISPIDGKPMIYFPSYQKVRRVAMTSSVTFGLLLVVVGAVASVFALKLLLGDMKNFTVSGMKMGNVLSSTVNAIQILIFNNLYGDLALTLNQYENHRTDTEFEDSLIAKTFIFQFVNSFTSMFYIAFMKPYATGTTDECVGSCMQELQTAVGTVFVAQLAIGNILEVGYPTLKTWFVEKFLMSDVSSNTKDVSKSPLILQDPEISEIELAFLMPEYHVMLGPFGDYAELVVQFGFTTMFVAAFPLAATLSYINNYVELRVDGWKLCEMCRRPEPRSCEDIGTWYTILEGIATISVFTNSGIVAYSGGVLNDYSWTLRAWIFFSMSTAIFCLKGLIALLIPDVSTDVDIQIRRQELIHDTVVGEMDFNDDDDDGLDSNLPVPPIYTLQDFDEGSVQFFPPQTK